MKNRVLMAFCLIFISSLLKLHSQDSAFVKSNRFYLHAGGNQWSQPTAGQLDKVAINYRANKSLDFGARFERTFYPKFYYAIALNYTQLRTDLELNFNRNDFYPWFGSQENGPNQPLSMGISYLNDCFGLSVNLGYEWINSRRWLIKTALGLHGAHFIADYSGSFSFTELQTINGIPYSVSTANIIQPWFNGRLRDIADTKPFKSAFQIQGEVIHKLNRLHIGLGYTFNIGFRKLFKYPNAIDFLPRDPQYRQKTGTEMKFNYWGIRFFVGF